MGKRQSILKFESNKGEVRGWRDSYTNKNCVSLAIFFFFYLPTKVPKNENRVT